MSKSIMQTEKKCFMCNTTQNLQKHHVMNGANRKLAEQDGLWIWLCAEHHTGNEGVHRDAKKMQGLKRLAQAAYEYDHTREEWMERYGRNYRD